MFILPIVRFSHLSLVSSVTVSVVVVVRGHMSLAP